MISKALLARFESVTQQDENVEQLLFAARATVQQEPATKAWFGLRFGRGDYGIFDVFTDDAGRQVHLDGDVATALMGAKGVVLADTPEILPLDIIASKFEFDPFSDVTKGLLLTFKAKAGHEADVAAFLQDARRYVDEEPGTRAWFAFQMDKHRFGIFDVFPGNGARFSHLTGHIPRELAKHALTWLGDVPDIHLVDVLCVQVNAPGMHAESVIQMQPAL